MPPIETMGTTPYWPIIPLLVVFCAPLVAQVRDSSLTIRVESNRVLVPVTVNETWSCPPDSDQVIRTCRSGKETVKLRHPVDLSKVDLFHPDPHVIASWFDELPDLSFWLYEDGKEQRIEKVERIRSSDTGDRRDDLGQHTEWNWEPKGIWSSSDVAPHAATNFGTFYYIIAYAPPHPRKEVVTAFR